jgi:hypothetical protein
MRSSEQQLGNANVASPERLKVIADESASEIVRALVETVGIGERMILKAGVVSR